MSQLLLPGLLIFSATMLTYGEQLLTFDNAEPPEAPCGFPEPILFPTTILVVLRAFPQKFKFYSPMGNTVYFRWMYQKATNQAATTQAQLESLKPRVTFPDFVDGLWALAKATVEVFDPPTASYHVSCIPNNKLMTNLSCDVDYASPGCAHFGFGGTPISTTLIWSDFSAFLEWHCLEGGHQMFNVLSLNPALTQGQIDEIQRVVTSLGFKTENFIYQVYT